MSLGKSTNSIQIEVESVIDESFKLTIDTLVMRTIIPPRDFSENTARNWKHLNDITLADPHYSNPSHIDLLFGVDIYGLIIKNGVRKGLIYEPVAQNSHLGWLVFGSMSKENSFGVHINAISISDTLRKFWENEEVEWKPMINEEQANCVAHFGKTHTRLNDGS